MSMPDDRNILLSGEQAEVFDNQMDVDRALIEATDDCIAFRPQIEGEWNEFFMLGGQPPCLCLVDRETGEDIGGPYNWTCVIDVERAIKGSIESSGLRMRLQCAEPNTQAKREGIRQAAIQYVETAVLLSQKPGRVNTVKPARGFGK